METARWRLVKQVFQEALDQPESNRGRYLSTACGDDQQFRSEVEALLAAHADAGAFLASPTRGDAREGVGEAGSAVFEQLQRALAGRYSLERELGRGGMGIVYLARDVALDRPVAIKLLPPALAAQRDYRARFLREARTAAALSHPNIVPIHLVEEHDSLVYFVMAFVDGESLGDRVRRAGPLKPADAAKLVQEVAWALAYAHGRGVIHRDIKPDNILIDGGSSRALVTDFGIARVTSTGAVSQQGEVLGTRQYMSPEQASAAAVIDGRADLYSLGVTAFFALTGRLPFESQDPATLVAMHVTEPAPPVLSVRSGLPARLAEAVDRCLAKDPAARFANGEALAEAIGDAQVMRRDIAPSVREFLSAARSAVVNVAGLGALWVLVNMWWENASPFMPLEPILWIIGGMTAAAAIVPLVAARGVVRAGLDEHDVAEGAVASVVSRDAMVEHQLARAESFRRAAATPWGRAVSFLLALPPLLELAQFLTSVLRNRGMYYEVILHAFRYFGYLLTGVVPDILFLAFFGGVSALCLATAIAPSTVIGALTRGSPTMVRVLRVVWGGPVGHWLFRLAGVGLRKPKALPVPEAAPTEALLGRAASELFEELPKDARARMSRVPDVVKRLERAAGALRARRDQVARAIADVGEPGGTPRRSALAAELEAARTEAEHRFAAAVSALENLRLDLLRLRAGVGHLDDLTASIEQARAVGEAVDAELAARDVVDALTEQDANGAGAR